MSADSQAMYAVAAPRGPVMVTMSDGRSIQARLIGWHVKGGRDRARIEYLTGKTATVRCNQVTGVPT